MTPANRAALQKLGVRPLGEGSKDLDGLINRELVQWRRLISAANIKAD
jgi:hypothetical protein